jgi:N-acetylglucosaminyldiphosphoundecaprenol N-acetyl-beta-D-mannosaminyltransferase
MEKNSLLGIPLPLDDKNSILDKIKLYIASPKGFYHIVSLNPEIMTIASENPLFKKVVRTAQIRIVDGFGIVLAAQMLNLKAAPRLTGVDLMEELVNMASVMRLRVMLIGGKQKLAEDIAKCYNDKYPKAKFIGMMGMEDIKNPKSVEEREINSIVAGFRPQIVIASFGSPEQEIWLDRHKELFSGMVVTGVGGAFNYIGGQVLRAPSPLRAMGFEWLFRLFTQPWRWKRQMRLFKFVKLVVEQKWRKI